MAGTEKPQVDVADSSNDPGHNREPQSGDNDEQSDSVGCNSDDSSDSEHSKGGQNDADGEEAVNENGKQDENDFNTNAGWAEAMAKILGKKTPESKSSILMKNKELEKMKKRERHEKLERKKQIDKKRAWEMMYRKKPDVVTDRETERVLQRIATRGVVQLFNAVRKHQKTIDDKVKEIGGSERKKAKFLSSVSKKDFIGVLRKTEGENEVPSKPEKDTTVTADEKPTWNVLRDDFMIGASMKDWDKNSDQEESHSGREVEGSDTD
ncbi:uncharacterized protein V6R79_013561 [Siganus canaliculatus]